MQGGDKKIYNSRSRTFLAFCFCFILGVGIFSTQTIDKNLQFFIYCSFLLVIILLFFLWSNLKYRFGLFCLLFFILGGLRFYLAVPDKTRSQLSYYNGQYAIFTGVVSQEVSETVSGNQMIVNVAELGGKKVSGGILINLPLYTDFKFGDVVKVSCDLKAPQGKDNFLNYDKYLARNGVWSLCGTRVGIEKLNTENSFLQKVYIKFFDFKHYLQNRVNELWSEPQSALAAGLLYGARSGFTQEVSQDFSRVGLTHIVAVSGYNISIIAAVLMNILIRLSLDRRKAFFVVIGGIILFVFFTGASASVVRAGIMGIIVLLSTQLGRQSQVGNVLVFTAAVMLLMNPFVLIWDAGFQLSFLSTLGLIYISPILNNFGIENENNFVQTLLESFCTTLSAIIATLPLILFQFGRLSLVAPVANILILWTVPFLMLFCFLAILLSYIFYPLGILVAFPTYFGLKYVIITAHYLASWPWASVEFSLPIWAMAAIYVLLVIYVKNKNSKISARL
ncbi:MAG: ComEC/Rec2 family competence protein [Candidatus Magasanikbacteria bacterium]|nr:ComEC/Rec2 family competence protein [Candidatus Magasanikbacteria bacterium]